MEAYLGLTPERGGSLLRGLRFLMTSICGLRTGLITEMVWPLSRLNASGGRADGSSRLSPSGWNPNKFNPASKQVTPEFNVYCCYWSIIVKVNFQYSVPIMQFHFETPNIFYSKGITFVIQDSQSWISQVPLRGIQSWLYK